MSLTLGTNCVWYYKINTPSVLRNHVVLGVEWFSLMKSFWAHGESFGWDYPHCFVSWPVTASPSPEDTFNCASSLAVVPCFARAAHQRESPSLVSMERERARSCCAWRPRSDAWRPSRRRTSRQRTSWRSVNLRRMTSCRRSPSSYAAGRRWPRRRSRRMTRSETQEPPRRTRRWALGARG